jgi:predicted dehydrogenase
MSEKLRWGILGTGNIAGQFCVGVNASRRGVLAAIGSRSPESAEGFAARHEALAAYGSYEQVLADPAVQAVYVSLPNTLHHEWTIKSLRAGKHVLCEKPLAVDAAESQEMFDVARKQRRVLIEAFMYRAHPLTHAVMACYQRGEIGQLQLIRTSFCYRTSRIAGNIRFDPSLAGGALMDVGCYCINFSRFFSGADPLNIAATAQNHESGVDQVAAATMLFPSGIVATFACGMSVQADNAAYLCGTEGYIEVPIPWKPPAHGATFSVVRAPPPRQDQPSSSSKPTSPNAGPRQTFTIDAGMDLYGLEADDFAATVLDDKPPMMSAEESIANMRTLDEMRRQICKSA